MALTTYNNRPVTDLTTPLLISDFVSTTGGSIDSIPPMTTAVNATSGLTVTVSAACEVQSTAGAFLLPRLTTAQLAATTFTPTPGMIARDSTLGGLVRSQSSITGGTANNFTPLSTYTTSGILTPAQFIAGYAVPVTLIAAPGTGGVIIVRSFYLELVWTALNTQYTLGGAVSLQYGTTLHAGGTLATATIAAAGINAAIASTLFTAAVVDPLPTNTALTATFANVGISISNDNVAFATGTSPIKYYIEYSIMPV